MPRHPPCALKNKHTNHHTQTTQPTKRKPCSPHTAAKNELDKINTQEKITSHTQHHQTSGIMQMLASTIQFSHNTPTNKHTPPQQMTRINQPGTQTGTMPQTPNNAPTYNKHSFSYTWTLFYACHKAPFTHSALSVKVYLLPGNLQQLVAAEHSPTQPPTHTQWVRATTAAHTIKNSLERR